MVCTSYQQMIKVATSMARIEQITKNLTYSFGSYNNMTFRDIQVLSNGFLKVRNLVLYTETKKLCPLDVYVCQFLMYERISFIFLH